MERRQEGLPGESRGLISCENLQVLPPEKEKNDGMMPSPLWLLFLARKPIWKMEANTFNI